MRKIYKKIIFALIILTIVNISTMINFAGWQQVGVDFYYVNDQTAQYVRDNWLKTQYGYYYLDETGKMVRGWRLINNEYYYFADNGLMQTGFVEAGGYKYYMDETGKMVRGWVELVSGGEATYYYLDENGQLVNGWKTIGEYWYYFNDYKCIVDSWANVNGEWYRFNKYGQLVTGWYLQGGKYYYLSQTSGQMVKGWIQDVNGYKYYLSPIDGTLAQNTTLEIDGLTYTFNQSGQVINASQGFYNAQGLANTTSTGVNLGVVPGYSQTSNVISSTYTNTKANQQGGVVNKGSTAGPK